MSNSLKNLLLILGVLTIGYGGYYLYISRGSTTLDTGATDAEYQAMLTRTQSFIQLRQELDGMQFNLNLFEDARFRTLQSYATPLKEVESGRSNPFATVGSNGE